MVLTNFYLFSLKYFKNNSASEKKKLCKLHKKNKTGTLLCNTKLRRKMKLLLKEKKMAGLKDGTPAMEVYQSVRNAIVQKQLKPGETLTEGALCKNLGVGRSPVRAALQQLSEDGYVEMLPNCSAHVAQFTQKQLRQLCSLRGMFLGYVLDLTIDTYTEKDLTMLQDCLTQQESAFERRDFDEYIAAVSRFYTIIISKANNAYLNEISAMIINRIGVYLCLYDNFYSVKKLKTLPLHYQMLNGIREGKPKKVLRAHNEVNMRILDAYDYMVSLSTDL